jgi:hypothetical protein
MFPGTEFTLNNAKLNKTNCLEYLGIEIDNKLDFDSTTLKKFSNVSKSIFSLSFLGLTPNGVNPELQAFLYKTYCLSQFTYALETTTLKKSTIDFLNVSQNNLIRQMIGLNKYCHISKILRALKIFNFEELYLKSKLSFISSIKNNELSLYIYSTLLNDTYSHNKNSKSFVKDIISIQKHFNTDTLSFTNSDNIKSFKNSFSRRFSQEDGLTDTIRMCLSNIKKKFYKNLLNELTKPAFIREDDSNQELFQYFIITGLFDGLH